MYCYLWSLCRDFSSSYSYYYCVIYSALWFERMRRVHVRSLEIVRIAHVYFKNIRDMYTQKLFGFLDNGCFGEGNISYLPFEIYSSLWTKLSFCFGGLITLFQLFHTPCKVRKLPSHQRNSKRVFVLCTLVSPQLSTTLSRKIEVFSFRFLRRALSYLSRTRTSAPRRPPAFAVIHDLAGGARGPQDLLDQLSSTGVLAHYSAESCARRPCPALQTPYI